NVLHHHNDRPEAPDVVQKVSIQPGTFIALVTLRVARDLSELRSSNTGKRLTGWTSYDYIGHCFRCSSGTQTRHKLDRVRLGDIASLSVQVGASCQVMMKIERIG